MTSVTAYFRLEPANDPTTSARSAAALTHDPLWLLARQRQLGEFSGIDGGSPIVAQAKVETRRVGALSERIVAPGEVVDGVPIGADEALECRLEREPIAPGSPLAQRISAESGALLATMLADAELGEARATLLASFALTGQTSTTDHRSAARLALLAGRVLDGDRVRAALGSDVSTLVSSRFAALPTAQKTLLISVLTEWAEEHDRRIERPASGTPLRALDAGFTLGASELAFAAPRYGGELEWFAFDQVAGAQVRGAPAVQAHTTPTMIPVPVSFPGKAQNRFWEIEDEEIRLAPLLEDEGGLVRAALLEFVVASGVEWFLIPVALPTGAHHRVAELAVTDTFGERLIVPPIAAPRPARRRFALWPGGVLLASAARAPLASEAVERLELVRDEATNLVWAIEDVVDGFLGPVQLSARTRSEPPPVVSDNSPAPVRYRAESQVPVGYHPLFDQAGRLVRARVLEPDGAERRVESFTLEHTPFAVAALPPGGVSVERNVQCVRAPSGRWVSWVGRAVRPGRAVDSPRIRFDSVG